MRLSSCSRNWNQAKAACTGRIAASCAISCGTVISAAVVVGEGMAKLIGAGNGRVTVASNALHDLVIKQRSIGLLSFLEDAVDRGLVSRESLALEPENHIRFAGHGTDFDDLLHSKVMRRHA